jgi:hypothetical protein
MAWQISNGGHALDDITRASSATGLIPEQYPPRRIIAVILGI